MKNEQEKSDLFIVAMKRRTDLGDRVWSRWSQGRGPRRTRESKHTRRTLSRVRVSQRLDRVRGAACGFAVSHPR